MDSATETHPATGDLTGWLPGKLRPVREGVYLRRRAAAPYACWSGGRWYADADTPEAAAGARRVSAQQAVAWRGVTTPPPGPCFACRGHGVVDFGWDEHADRDLIDECPEC